MVISFSLFRPLKYLLDNKHVYTFRINKRTKLGNDWFNEGRGKKKLGNCNIYLIDEFGIDTNITLAMFLHKYVMNSGFNSRLEWIECIVNLNNNRPVNNGFLYRVDLR